MFVSPMLLQSIPEPPDDSEDYITELKLDGHRMIVSRFNGKTRLYTRHRNEVTTKYPEIASIEIEEGTILDGELVALGEDGKPDFELLQQRSRSNKYEANLQFVAFDILYHRREKVTHKPLVLRKELIPTVIPHDQSSIAAHNYIHGNASAYYELVAQMGLEGIVVKNPHSSYKINTRSKEWLKVINYQYADVFITGYRKSEFGLLLTDAEGKPLGIMEHMGPRKEYYSRVKDLEDQGEFVRHEPIRCQVKFRNYTKNGYLRIPVFVSFI
ncbi:ATP-dependent DNA ligase [Alkalicoccobacillus porphyridii]|uniref:ATP-dependent DNA ligase n=1 Tax=Alkalicoccobacillus porphyridii TaxID=2597270 RepID=A0A554A0B4_9BACI|nr:RNA ligase family protein [Alkalicoccobacillus porphyridii]TSB47113.1 ATP-dependent DNA ligase [Alkalicoccobacillus porphyridii]